MQISFVIPSRNNLKYFKWAYQAIRKNQGNHDAYICAASDASTDGTVEYFQELSLADPKFKYIVNQGPERLGHTILYDRIINELVETDVAIIYHADMYLAPGALDAIESHMYSLVHTDHVPGGFEKVPEFDTVVSLTRIEPPLHPPGPEKITRDFGTEPEDFNEEAFLEDLQQHPLYIKGKTTEGVFAPWAFFVETFKQVHGHDPLYAPQSKEDSDIFNKFQLIGVKFIQTWEGFVYHMTCRGNRRNTHDGAPNIQTDNPEWLAQNVRSSRNFIRKWGHFVKHDEYMKPIIPKKYNIGFILEDANLELLQLIEPWVSNLYYTNTVEQDSLLDRYIELEQKNTFYDLRSRVQCIQPDQVEQYCNSNTNDIMVHITRRSIEQAAADYFIVIQNISDIISESGQIGIMEFNLMRFKINQLIDYSLDTLELHNNMEGSRK
jgi:glycosyltransferase involved in cell wall biosynthesis